MIFEVGEAIMDLMDELSDEDSFPLTHRLYPSETFPLGRTFRVTSALLRDATTLIEREKSAVFLNGVIVLQVVFGECLDGIDNDGDGAVDRYCRILNNLICYLFSVFHIKKAPVIGASYKHLGGY